MGINSPVQMYYVSEGTPVAFAGNSKQQNYRQPEENGVQTGLAEAFVHKTSTKALGQHQIPNGNSRQRSDSLESLLTLNVLAFQLLNDHDDLQSVNDSHYSNGRTFSPNGSEVYSDSSAKTSSHNRFNSYSTVSTNAPETPPSSHHASFSITDMSPTIRQGFETSKHTGINGLDVLDSSSNAGEQTMSNGHTENIPFEVNIAGDRTLLRKDWSQNTISAPRIESMIIKRAISSEAIEASSSENQDHVHLSVDDQKTPSAELINPLAASVSGYTMRFQSGNGSSSRSPADNVRSIHDTHSEDNVHEQPKLGSALDHTHSQASPTFKDKGKARAIDQVDETVESTDQNDSHGHIRLDSELASEGSAVAQAASMVPISTSNKKISEWLREQYEYKQRSGGYGAPAVSQSTYKGAARTGTSSAPSSKNEIPQATSPQGRPLSSLPSQNSQKSKLSGDTQTERAELLHTIISQDFGNLNGSTSRPIVRSQSKDLLWHPTEYVGPPRRQSISGTSMLGLGRKGQDSRPSLGRHQRQRSADILGTTSGSESRVVADELGRRHKFAASADDLLSRTRLAPKEVSGSEATYAYETVTPSARSRLFSIKRKQPSSTPNSSHFGGTTYGSLQDRPFHHMVDTDKMPLSNSVEKPSLGHKRSISGSIQGLLSGFSTSSFSRRKRNLSINGIGQSPEAFGQTRSISPLPASDTMSAMRQTGHDIPKQHPSIKQANGRQSPFKLWTYPPATQNPGRDELPDEHARATSAIYVHRTQVIARSSPPVPFKVDGRPENQQVGAQGNFVAGSQALSTTDTIAEAEGENDAISIENGTEEEEDEETIRLKDLASQQVARDSDLRARLVEKFKEGDRSASSLGQYSNIANGH